MRITTKMLNDSARKAGLPIGNTSLLNYINKGNNTTENAMLQAWNKKSGIHGVQKKSCEDLEKSAAALEKSASMFSTENADKIFAQAKKDGKVDGVKQQAKDLISNYNETLKKLGKTGLTLDSYYKQMLQSAAKESKDALTSIGIVIEKDGSLRMDESKFDAADIDALQEAFGKLSPFSAKVSLVANHVAENAKSNLDSIANQYSASGKNYPIYANNQFNFWG